MSKPLSRRFVEARWPDATTEPRPRYLDGLANAIIDRANELVMEPDPRIRIDRECDLVAACNALDEALEEIENPTPDTPINRAAKRLQDAVGLLGDIQPELATKIAREILCAALGSKTELITQEQVAHIGLRGYTPQQAERAAASLAKWLLGDGADNE